MAAKKYNAPNFSNILLPLLGHPLKLVFTKKTGKSIKSEKSDFCQIWQLGGSRWVQNTPTSGGNDLPARESPFREKKV